MTTSTARNLAARKVLFVVLLAVIVLAIVYAILQNRPWTVPEAAKQVKNPLPASDAALKATRDVYSEHCARCHGDSGRGDGRDAALYYPAPGNFTDAQHMRSMTDGEIFYKISEGRKPMPAFQKKLSEEQRWQLVLLIRFFTAPGAGPGDTSGAPPNASSGRP
jgi:mono/diheme cytochrome c family protein